RTGRWRLSRTSSRRPGPGSPGHEADGLDLVAVGVADEGGVVVAVVLGPQAGRAVVGSAAGKRDAMEFVDLRPALGDEADVGAVADAGGLAVDRLFEAEADRRGAVVDRPAAALALGDAEHREHRIVERRGAARVVGA